MKPEGKPLIIFSLLGLLLIGDAVRPNVFSPEGLIQVSSQAGGGLCQYLPRRGRPEDASSFTGWKDSFVIPGWPKTTSLPECREACDKESACVGFVRIATEDPFFLDDLALINVLKKRQEDKSEKSSSFEKEAMELMIKSPEDYASSDCWLLKGAVAKNTSSFDGLQRMDTTQKAEFWGARPKITYEQRNCECGFRYLGVPRGWAPPAHLLPELPEGITRTAPEGCEGIYKFVAREFPPTAESVYQKLQFTTDAEGNTVVKIHFLLRCAANEGTDKHPVFNRRWYCTEADEMKAFLNTVLATITKRPETFTDRISKTMTQLMAAAATANHKSIISKSSSARDALRKLLKHGLCPGIPISEPLGGPGASTIIGWSPKRRVKAEETEAASGLVSRLRTADTVNPLHADAPLQVSDILINKCVAEKDDGLKLQKEFQISQVPKCLYDKEELARYKEGVTKWLGSWVGDQALSRYGVTHAKARVETVAYAMVEILFRKLRIDALTGSDDAWERTTCAKELVDQVLTVGGVFPKVSQNLALRKDLVEDDYIRNVLKETQTENKAKTLEEVKQHLRNNDAKWEGIEIEYLVDLDQTAKTIGVGSVGQVLMLNFAETPDSELAKKISELKRKLGGKEKAVLKLVFPDNEVRYKEDYDIIDALYECLVELRYYLDPEAENSGFAHAASRALAQRMIGSIIVPKRLLEVMEAFLKLKGSMLAEFDLFEEARFTERGLEAAEDFDPKILRGGYIIKVPKVMKTSCKYALFQEQAIGETLKRYMSNIEGSALELVGWKHEMFDSVVKLYGHLILKWGFWQSDPHPGNWLFDRQTKTMWLIDWGAVGDFSLQGPEGAAASPVSGAPFHCRLATFYKDLNKVVKEYRESCNVVTLAIPVKLIQNGVYVDMRTRIVSKTYWGVIEDFTSTRREPRYVMLGRDDDDGWQVSIIDPSATELSRFAVPWLVCEEGPGVNCLAETLDGVLGPEGASFVWSKKEGTPRVERIPVAKPTSDRRKCSDDDNIRDAMAQLALNLGIKVVADPKQRPNGQHLVDQKNALAIFSAASNTDLDMILKRAAPMMVKGGEESPAKAMVSSYPDDIVPVVRSLQAIYGMVMDVVVQNPPPFVQQTVNSFIRTAGLDQLVSTWSTIANAASASCSVKYNIDFQVIEDAQCDAGVADEGQLPFGVTVLMRAPTVDKVLANFALPAKAPNGDFPNCRQVYNVDDCKNACLSIGHWCRGFTFWKKYTQCCWVGGEVEAQKEQARGGLLGFLGIGGTNAVDCYLKESLLSLTSEDTAFFDAHGPGYNSTVDP